MCSWAILFILFAMGGEGQEHGPVFLMEPPPRLLFSNSSGARVACAAHGFPPPLLAWQLPDGTQVDSVSGLRQVLENGTLVFKPFAPAQFRQDVHAAVYRCRAHNTHGAIVSREMRAQAVIWQEWEARVSTSSAETGGPALLTCVVPTSFREHASVAAWYRDDTVLPATDHLSGSTLLMDEGWKLIVRSVRAEDARAQFSCSVLDSLTGERRRSAPAHIDIAPANTASAPRAITHGPWEGSVRRGGDVLLPCLVHASPPPTITWYREAASGVLRELREGEGGGRLVRAHDALSIRRAEPADAGRWACRAANAHGHLTLRLHLNLRAHLTVHAQPHTQVVNSGGTATINCTWSGYPAPRLEWLHNGIPLGAGVVGGRVRVSSSGEQLVISDVHRVDKGVYQCMARNEKDSAQASAELRLGDTAPELQYTFIEQVLRPGQVVTLKCSAAGSPPPHFTWLLDGQPLNTMNTRGHRYSIEQFVTKNKDVVSFLNITSVSSEDGGLYTCRATNSLGEVSHTSRLNIYGPPYVRPIGPIRAVAGRELVLYCPYSGYPVSSVKWERNGSPVEWESNSDGALRVTRVEPSHAGAYTCVVMGPHGEMAKKELQLFVSNPPEIEPFSFSANLQEGKRAQVSCSVISGDMPVHFTWLKDNQPIPSSLQVEERGADFFSNLVFKEVSAHHSGMYTCVASNSAAKVNYTAQLVVKVSPKWVIEPKNEAVLAGESVALHCQTTGSPTPQVTWLKPHTAYMIRIAAINQLDRSLFTEPVVVKTQEEAPSEAPTNVHVTPGGPGELHVSWRPPPREAWHGELLGYSVTCTEFGPGGIPVHNSSRTLTVNGWSATELSLSALRKFTRYEVRVRAFNGVAAGPASTPVSATTLEGVPESHPTRVTCSALSSSSMKVTWNPPPLGQHGGIIQGYKVIYTPLTSDHDVGEIKRVTTTDTYLHALRKYTNYSIQVLAFTNAGDGKRSPPVYCMTEEDVPSQPQKIKALAFSSDSVLVSWLPPLYPNGIISHYTVYFREAGRLGKHSSFTVSADKKTDIELMFQVRNLLESQLYEFWVSATTGSGEGESTPVVGQGPNARIPARIASFGGLIAVGVGQPALLTCTCVGAPAPRSRWTHGRTPVTHHAYYQVTHRGHLHIREVNEQSSGNFTCTASNTIGEDSIVYVVSAILPPAAPALSLQYTTASSIKLHWQLAATDVNEPILGYLLHYKQASEPDWHTAELSNEMTSYTMDMLKCGTTYKAKIQARNKISIGPPSEVLTATTRGGRPKPPKAEEHVYMNTTAIKINFYAWRDGGCPILGFRVSYRRAGSEHWIKVGDNLSSASHVLGDLTPGTWYELAIEASSDAGIERVTLFADTHTLTGARIPPLKPSSPIAGSVRQTSLRTVLLSCIASAVVVLCALAAVICLVQHKRKFFCISNDHYMRDDRKLSESNEAEREKLREGQKLYSSSSINGNEKSNDDSSAELYEISPYATFGVSAAHSLQFRTLARRDDDAAAPPHRRRHRACEHYRYDESSLSKCSTVEARHRLRAASAGTASGAATPAGWRDAHTDSDDNSDSAANTTTKGSGESPGSVYGSGRRSARTTSSGGPNGSDGLSGSFAPVPADISSLIDKYQQRKEQERRECTIHV
ncbi:Down syndrome cell adhesion molecule-like protein Dscam2 isoform X4 [Hyposmocoma kahamanoa]|uniref:Down syndrome cell adhesion molecule-like protein Dscam2 isoform X4 n=1 Tax=Hyposmocoma kahamanoa TaxID=1477025 RepID=UPI000E6D7B61|nr:Down syndrome cell adhesion molecule-like protein Dscam2 isoform X4 [Hyposmocoma kahamanoa]